MEEKLLFKVDGSKWKNLNDFSNQDIILLSCDKITIKNKTKINLENLNKADINRLFLLDQKQNKKYLERYRDYYMNFYNNFKDDLNKFKLFNVTSSNKLKGMLTLNFSSAFCCYNIYCNNFLRCYSKKIERCRPNVLKMIARQAVIFNTLPTNKLVEKIKQELINHFNKDPEAPRQIRLCQYGSINQRQFNKLLKVIDKLYYFLVNADISFYIYMDGYLRVPEEYRYFINSLFFINSSNARTYQDFKHFKINTNKILSIDKVFFEELQEQEPEKYNYCGSDCTTCDYCKTAQEKPIIFKNH